MTNDYSKWYYWYAFWKQESSNKIECTMMRMSILYPMTQMIKVFQQNKSKLSFKPDSLMIGRSSTATEGMRIYDTDATDEALKLYLNKQLVDMCVVQLVEASSKQEAQQIMNMSRAGLFDQLDDFLKTSKKKKKN